MWWTRRHIPGRHQCPTVCCPAHRAPQDPHQRRPTQVRKSGNLVRKFGNKENSETTDHSTAKASLHLHTLPYCRTAKTKVDGCGSGGEAAEHTQAPSPSTDRHTSIGTHHPPPTHPRPTRVDLLLTAVTQAQGGLTGTGHPRHRPPSNPLAACPPPNPQTPNDDRPPPPTHP